MLRITNNSGSEKTYGEVVIADGASFDVPAGTEESFRTDPVLRADLLCRLASTSDGHETWTGMDARDFLDTFRQIPVVTALEKPDKDLVLASDDQPFVDGVCTLAIPVPGEIGQQGARLIAGGYAFTNIFGWGDRVSKVELVDKDFVYAGILYPAEPAPGVTWAEAAPLGVTLGSYTDDALEEPFRGWRLWADDGGQGGVDIDPLGGFGKLLAKCYLTITIEKTEASGATRGALNAWWARPQVIA